MAVREITPPEVEPLTLEEAKAHLRVEHDEADALIGVLIAAARRSCEKFTGRALVERTLELVLDEFPEAEIKLPRPPLVEVLSVKYDDAAGDEQTVADTDYDVDTANEPGWVVPGSSWPTTFDAINAVRIRYVAGYEPPVESPADLANNVPDDLKAGMLLLIGHLYANKESVVTGTIVTVLPMGVEFLWLPHRIEIGIA